MKCSGSIFIVCPGILVVSQNANNYIDFEYNVKVEEITYIITFKLAF